jgi:RNA polymerase sigma-70 factor, ECF subfamily
MLRAWSGRRRSASERGPSTARRVPGPLPFGSPLEIPRSGDSACTGASHGLGEDAPAVQDRSSRTRVRAMNAWPARDPRFDEPAFDELVRTHRSSLERFTHGLGASWEDAEEIAATALLRAYRRPPERGDREWRQWLRTVARNLWIDMQRRRVLRVIPDDGVLEQVRSHEQTVDQTAAMAADAREVCAAIALLPPPQRAVIYLREVRGLSYDEIALELGMTCAAVTSTLHRARQNVSKRGWLGSAMGIVFTPLFLVRRLPGVTRLVSVSSVGAKVAVPITLAATLGTATVIVPQQIAGLRPRATTALRGVAPARNVDLDRNRKPPGTPHPARAASVLATHAVGRASPRRPPAHRSPRHPSGQALSRAPHAPTANPGVPRPVEPATVAESTHVPPATVTTVNAPVAPSVDRPPQDAVSTPATAVPATRPPTATTTVEDGAGRPPVVGKAASTTGAEHRASGQGRNGQGRGTPPAALTAASRESLARPTAASLPPSASESARVPGRAAANDDPRASAPAPPTAAANTTGSPVASASAGEPGPSMPASAATGGKSTDPGRGAPPLDQTDGAAGATAADGTVPGVGAAQGAAPSHGQGHGADVPGAQESGP